MKRPLMLLALSLIAPAVAKANSYTQSSGQIFFTFNADTGPGPSFTFAGFDNTLGALTSVDVTAQGTSTDFGFSSLSLSGGQATFNTSFFLLGAVTGNSLQSAVQTSSGPLIKGAATANPTTFSFTTHFTNVLPFELIDDEFGLSPVVRSSFQGGPFTGSDIGLGTNLAFSVTETFNYIPEPTTLALMATGLLWLAVMRRRLG